MDTIYCYLCKRGKAIQTTTQRVCKDCRTMFEPLASNGYEFGRCLDCELCDEYGFPCRHCAIYTFEYRLGSGNGEGEEFANDADDSEYDDHIMTVDQMLDTLDSVNNREDDVFSKELYSNNGETKEKEKEPEEEILSDTKEDGKETERGSYCVIS